MEKNINDKERVARVVGGSLLASLAFVGPKKPWMLAFLVPVAEGLVGKCLLYSALGVSTRKEDQLPGQGYFRALSSSEVAAGHAIVGVA